MFKKITKSPLANIFILLVFIFALSVSLLPAQLVPPKAHAAIPAGCPGGPAGPANPNTTCPAPPTPGYQAVAYCRSQVGLAPPVPSYNPTTADLNTACALGFLAGYKNTNTKNNVCNAIALPTTLGGLYVPNDVQATGTPAPTPSPGSGGGVIPGPGIFPTPSPTPTPQPNFGGDEVKVCKQSYDAGNNQAAQDVGSALANANSACDQTDPTKKSQCQADVKKCQKKKKKSDQTACLSKIADNYPPQSTDAAGDTGASCDGQGLSLGWIICGMTEVVQNFVQDIFSNFIQPMMENTPLSLNPKDPFYKSWQGFRLLGNIMLIGSMLAIVYSQARGGGGGN